MELFYICFTFRYPLVSHKRAHTYSPSATKSEVWYLLATYIATRKMLQYS